MSQSKRAYWFDHIRKFKSGTATQKDYCNEFNLSYDNFSYYKKLYRSQAKTTVKKLSSNASFIPVAMTAPTNNTEDVTLILSNAISLRFNPNINVSQLDSIIKVLRAC